MFPVQAKGGRDRMSTVQIEQDIALCAEKFPRLVCRPLGAQFHIKRPLFIGVKFHMLPAFFIIVWQRFVTRICALQIEKRRVKVAGRK